MKRATVLVVVATIALLGAAPAHAIPFEAFLDGPSESPPNASPGTGFATVDLDVVAHTLVVTVSFSDLIGTTTASHVHCCTAVPLTGVAGVATQTPTFTGFPLGVTSGFYTHGFDTTMLSTFNAPFVAANGGTAAGAEAALLAGLLAGRAYLNIHSTFALGGEIRGFLQPVPEPGALGLVAAGLVLLLGRTAYRRRHARPGP